MALAAPVQRSPGLLAASAPPTLSAPPSRTQLRARITPTLRSRAVVLRPRRMTPQAQSADSAAEIAEPSAAASGSTPSSADEPTPVAIPVVIPSPKGHQLAGILMEPPSAAPGIGSDGTSSSSSSGSAPLAILCHGFRSSKKSSTLETVSQGLYSKGVPTFRFDFSGNGESGGPFGVGNYAAEVQDLRCVVDHWRAQGRTVAAILGHSKGGNVVLLYAAQYQDVPCVVNLAGRCEMERGLKERYGEEGLRQIQEQGHLDVDSTWDGSYRVTREDIEQRLATNMRKAAASIPSTCRVLSVHGSEDTTVPADDARIFSTLIANHELVVIQGGDHRFSRQFRGELVDAVVPFIAASVFA